MREKFRVGLELQAVDGKRNTFTGVASVPGSLIRPQPPANQPTFFLPGAWTRTLKERASKIAIYGGESHGKGGHAVMIGHLLSGFETNTGRLQVTGHISNTAIGKDDLELMRDGALKELSVGWIPIATEKVTGKQLTERLAKMSLPAETASKMKSYVEEFGQNEQYRLVREAMLDHVAIVREGADTETEILEVNENLSVDELVEEYEADNKPYGDVAYADPGFQKDKKKRYPINNEKHIRAAWNYISKAKNAAQYSSSQVAKIKARIIAAWKAKIDKDGPPSAQEKDEMLKPKLEQHQADPDALFLSMRPLVNRIVEILDLEQTEEEPAEGSPEEQIDMQEDYQRLDEIKQLAAGLSFLANFCYSAMPSSPYNSYSKQLKETEALLKKYGLEELAGRMLSAANEKKLQSHADNLHAHGDAAHAMAADLQDMINSMYKTSATDETPKPEGDSKAKELTETTPTEDAAVLIERENISREAKIREAILRQAKLSQEMYS